jgi:AbrB family looped-hinge helix DNA binding protein
MARVTVKGQVTIPKSLRRRFGITPATEIEFQEQRGKLVLVKKQDAPQPVSRIRGRLKRLPFGRDVDEYLSAVRGE